MTIRQTGLLTLRRVSGRLKDFLSKMDTPASETPLPRLLVVDDQDAICFSISEYFEFHGYKVDITHNVEDAEKLVKTVDYKAIIQDLRLGKTDTPDGLYIVELARHSQPSTRLIVLTAFSSPEVEDEARRCGADAFLRKPIPLSQLAQIVQGLIEAPTRGGGVSQ